MQFELLDKHHNRQAFDCGNDDINRYLWQMASQHHKRGVARVHILANDSHIVGFYTLTSTNLDNSDNGIRGYPHYIPAILIGRMGVDIRYQGQGLSKTLLWSALTKIKAISQDTGVMVATIDPKNESLANYYTQYGFKPLQKSNRLIMSVEHLPS